MAILQILKHPDETLSMKSKHVTEFGGRLHVLLDDMHDTLVRANGMGLAAAQVGRLMRACIVDTGKQGVLELINPEIIVGAKEKDGEEACLSVPNKAATMKRYHHIKVKYQDRFGTEHIGEFRGMVAVCIQHEMDHMDGVLIV